MIEPMQPDLAEAVRRLPAAEQPSWAGPWQPVTSVSAVTSIGSHDVQILSRHARATRAWRSSRSQAAAAAARSRHIICAQNEGFHGLQAHWSAGANRPAEAALCLESRARISGRALTIRNMKDSAIPFGGHSRPMPMRDQFQLAAARLRCEPRSHAVDWTGEVGSDG